MLTQISAEFQPLWLMEKCWVKCIDKGEDYVERCIPAIYNVYFWYRLISQSNLNSDSTAIINLKILHKEFCKELEWKIALQANLQTECL